MGIEFSRENAKKGLDPESLPLYVDSLRLSWESRFVKDLQTALEMLESSVFWPLRASRSHGQFLSCSVSVQA